MNRREFSLIMGGAGVSVFLRSTTLAQQPGLNSPGVSEAAAELYRRALVLDCNSGPPYEDGRLPLAQADLDMVRNCGVNLVKWTLGGMNLDFAETVKGTAYVQQMIEVHPAYFMQVRVPADMERARLDGKMGLIISFESADMLDGKLGHFELFRNLGVRVMQFSYNRKSSFGAGIMEPNGGGLTPLGKEAAKRMNALGIAIDLSHANAQTTMDALACSSRPLIMSHSGCAAIHSHPRNKTDEQLRALADKGGVVGIYDCSRGRPPDLRRRTQYAAKDRDHRRSVAEAWVSNPCSRKNHRHKLCQSLPRYLDNVVGQSSPFSRGGGRSDSECVV